MPAQPTVFISYSHRDEEEKNQLLTHLGVLQSHGLIKVWSDDRIGAGGDWEGDINQAMFEAEVAILLVTANFLTSNFILGQEVPRLLQRRRDEGVTVFPVIAKPCDWQGVAWLTKMNVRPKNGTPVWRQGGVYADEELAKIAAEVRAILQQKASGETFSAPGASLADLVSSSPGSTPTPPAIPTPIASSGQPAAGDYDLGKVRRLLNDIFSEEDLRNLCLYESPFRPVHDSLKGSDRKPEILRNLLEHVDRKGLMAVLLDRARETNAARYQQDAPYTRSKAPVPPSPAPASAPPAGMTKAHKRKLVQALLACPSISDRHKRDTIINDLPDSIRNNIQRNSADNFDVMNLVNACLNYAGGLQELIDALEFYEGDSLPVKNVKQLVG